MVRATFYAEHWIGDYAVSADKEESWDATLFLDSMTDSEMSSYREEILDTLQEEGEFRDRDDYFFYDPAAPEWIREWTGPFRIILELF